MRRKLLTVGLLLLVTVNLAALGTLVYHRFGGHGDIHPRGESHQEMRSLHQRLGLSEEQERQMRELRERFRRETKPIEQVLRQKRTTLIDLLGNMQVDTAAIYAIQVQIDSLQADFQRAVLRHLLAEMALLTPQQRTEFLSLIRQRLIREEAHHGGQAFPLREKRN